MDLPRGHGEQHTGGYPSGAGDETSAAPGAAPLPSGAAADGGVTGWMPVARHPQAPSRGPRTVVDAAPEAAPPSSEAAADDGVAGWMPVAQ